MKKYLISSGFAAATLLAAGVVFAQTVGPAGVVVGSTPVTTAVTPGNGVTLGTFTVTGDPQGATITSIPLNLAISGGATSTSSLSNCQVFNAAGAAVGTAFSPTATNNVVFPTAISVGGTGTASNTYSIRCDVAAATPAGSIFQFNAGTPSLGNALNLSVVAPSVVGNSANQLLGIISLDATHSGGNINVSSIPVTITGNGASVAQLSNCQLRNANNLTGTLGATSVTTGTTMSFTLGTPISVPAGTRLSVALTCDVAPVTPIGSTFTVSVAPASLGASSGGVSVTPTATLASNGSALPTSAVVTVSTDAGGGGTTIPGFPSTGEGGLAPLAGLILALSSLAALGAGLFLKRSYR